MRSLVLGLAVLILSGCTAESTAPSPGASPTFTAVPYPMPDFGPKPTMPPLTDAEAETQRVVEQDDFWQRRVLDRFPDAVRPEVKFGGYVTDDDWVDIRRDCYTAAGLPFDIGTNPAGKGGALSPNVDTESNAVAGYVCDSEHPFRPLAPLDARVLGWYYDYLTEFLAPCYAANGIRNTAPPSREYFIANFPDQGWWPSQGSSPMGTAVDDAIDAACPPPV